MLEGQTPEGIGETRGAVVLHLTEAFGGGLANAVTQYARSTPEFEHHLIRTVRTRDFVEGGESGLFSSVHDLGVGHLRRLWRFWRAVQDLRPDVVHAHSSWAGVYLRVLPGGRRRPRRVYTPHCFAFERRDFSPLMQRTFRAVEQVLGHRSDVVAGCSQREVVLARRLSGRWTKVVFLPNVAATPVLTHRAEPPTDPRRVVAIGRLDQQKDPDFFAEVVRRCRRNQSAVDFTWVGGPEDSGVAAVLRDLDVTVTGWLPQPQVQDHLEGALAYVHTAQWEGAPVALLEASALGLAVVARSIPPLDDCPPEWLAEDPGGVAARIADLVGDPAVRMSCAAAWADHFAGNTVEAQSAALRVAYTG